MDSKGHNPIHTTRIINQTMKFALNSSLETDRREEIKNCLDKLKYVGDLVSFSKGRWLPAPLREIIIDSDLEESILVGGVPSNAFPKRISKEILYHKQFRKIVSGLIDEIHSTPKINLNFWAQIPNEDLESWAIKIKSIPLEELPASNERGQFELYIPQPQKHKAVQNYRWTGRFERASGKYLCRNPNVTGKYNYYIAEVRNGEIVALSNTLPQKYYQRIMYAEDFAHGESVIASTEIKNGELIVKLSNPIPLGEYRIFDALGDSDTDTADFIIWKFDVKYLNIVIKTLQNLKIKIEG